MRDLAEARARVGDDLDVGGGVAADGAEGAIGDAVAGDEHAAGAKDVDAVAVLAGAAAVGPDAHDAVGGDDAAVLAGSERQTWMPLLPQSAMSLWAISRPAASTLRMAAWMTALTVQSVTLPAQRVERDAVRGAARHASGG